MQFPASLVGQIRCTCLPYKVHTRFYSTKRDTEIACRPSVCLSVRPSVCNVGGLGSHKLEIFETNCTDN